MPTITAQSLIDKVEVILQDTTNIRWPETELLGWLNDAQREIASLRPDVSNVTASVALVAGTKQSIPAAGAALIDVRRNMGTNGSTAGEAIRKVPMEILDSQVPNWHTVTATASVKHYTYDPRTPRVFYVYPPSLGTTQVEVVYDAPPTAIAAVGNTISIDDEYANALVEYVLFRAYSKDHEAIGNAARAQAHRTLFDAMVNAKGQVDAAQVAKANIRG